MRLWTIHPRHLDAKGLVALWREGLLAYAVLRGRTRGYRHHPQLLRFRNAGNPPALLRGYLRAVLEESRARGYAFDASKIAGRPARLRISETRGQLQHEWGHLKRKLRKRSPLAYRALLRHRRPSPHPLFRIVPGPAGHWDKREPRPHGSPGRVRTARDRENGRNS